MGAGYLRVLQTRPEMHSAVVSFPAPVPASTTFPRTLCCVSQSDFLQVRGVTYRPPGSEVKLLDSVTFSLPQNSLGLIFGRSGTGKTTLLQVLAGLAKPTEGSVAINFNSGEGEIGAEQGVDPVQTGIVFQFPERYFLADTVLAELTFGLPSQSQDPFVMQQLFLQLHKVTLAVGLRGISWDTNPRSLSGGYKRRLALAVQLVRRPHLLLLDEPLAGLDWKARTDVIRILSSLKRELTLLIVSHDLKELAPLVDKAWRMELGGRLTEASFPSL